MENPNVLYYICYWELFFDLNFAINNVSLIPSCGQYVRNGLLVTIMLISNHKSLAEQLVACEITTVLNKCLSLQGPETMLAVIALGLITNVHKLEKKGNAQILNFKYSQY